MKIIIETLPEGSEPEIILRCTEMDTNLLQLINALNTSSKQLIGFEEAKMHLIDPGAVFYFETVDSKVFIYLEDKVYESKLRLYELEMEYGNSSFFRASKSVILNVRKIESISPVFDGRFKANLLNGEVQYISRKYVPVLKQKLGL